MIVGISGKIGSGKDTVGRIIQYLTCPAMGIQVEMKDWINKPDYSNFQPNWQIVKFAYTLKDVICILTGCTRKQLEDNEFKNSKLPDKWIRYGYADGFFKYYKNGKEETKMNNVQCDKERYELEYRTNWETAYKVHPTYRELLQYIGTDLLRNQFHEDVWVNALFSKYKCIGNYEFSEMYLKEHPNSNPTEPIYPNWIITDVRFPNELKAVKDRNGISIRVNRPKITSYYIDNNKTLHTFIKDKAHVTISDVKESEVQKLLEEEEDRLSEREHISETALDNYEFDYVIDNNGTIEELIVNVKQVLKNLKIIN